MKIGLVQINSWLGDFAGNGAKILNSARRAHAEACDLVVFPEAALFGYHPCDLLERPKVVEAQLKELNHIHKAMPKGMGILVGAIGVNPKREGKPYHNAAVLLEKGRPKRWFNKQLLPTYDVFDEGRHIEPGRIRDNVIRWRGQVILVTVCEDIWGWPAPQGHRFASYMHNPLKEVKGPVDLVINLSASPYAENKVKQRHRVVTATAKHFRCPMIYVNMVGAQDELVFDGGSFVITAAGKGLVQCKHFEEDFLCLDIETPPKPKALERRRTLDDFRAALVLGLRDFVRKNGFSKVHLGLSGGIDSAVVACIAAEALGPENVIGVGMPGPFSSAESLTLARVLAQNLEIQWREQEITPTYNSLLQGLEASIGKSEFGVMHENLQARVRAIVLMAIANREGSLLMATSNKSELATGYSTLYGDMCGAIMPIGDLLKHEVYAMAEHYNREREVIPRLIIDRPPSAELRPNQKDEDSLPPYDVLDPAVKKIVEGYRSAKGEVEERVLGMLLRSEFKRWQAPPILKVSDHAFGRGRRFPLAHKAKF